MFAQIFLGRSGQPLLGLNILALLIDVVKAFDRVLVKIVEDRELLRLHGGVIILCCLEMKLPRLPTIGHDIAFVVIDENFTGAFISFSRPEIKVVNAVDILVLFSADLFGGVFNAGCDWTVGNTSICA